MYQPLLWEGAVLTLPVSLIRSPLALPSRLTFDRYSRAVAAKLRRLGLWLLRGMVVAVAMPRQPGGLAPSRVIQRQIQVLGPIRPIPCRDLECGRNGVSERSRNLLGGSLPRSSRGSRSCTRRGFQRNIRDATAWFCA